METTKKTNENEQSYSTNWMLDNIIEAFEKRGINNGSNDDLIKELAIQKIEYGRTCIAQFLAKGGQTRQTMNGYWEKLDTELQSKILEVGGEPKKIQFG
jgi:hypothetical protein